MQLSRKRLVQKMLAVLALLVAASTIGVATRAQFANDWLRHCSVGMSDSLKPEKTTLGVCNYSDGLYIYRVVETPDEYLRWDWEKRRAGSVGHGVGLGILSVPHGIQLQHWFTVTVAALLALWLNWNLWVPARDDRKQ